MKAGVFIHPQALVESDDIGEGTRIWSFAHVMKGARIGSGCNLGDGAFVETGAVVGDRVTVKNGVCIWDGVEVGDDVFLGPNAVLTNVKNPRVGYRRSREQFDRTVLGRGATIGANATIVCGLRVGAWSFVGAGAVVIRHVPDHALVVGNPARQIAWVCRCCQRLPEDLVCTGCGLAFERDGDGLRLVHAGPA